MRNNMVPILIDQKLHQKIKAAAVKRGMKLQAFVDYIIRKGFNLTPRKQP